MTAIEKLKAYLSQPVSILPLVVFRIGFGLMMAAGSIRFWHKGWIDTLYLQPGYHFKYYGFSWIEVLPGNGMYIAYGLLIITSLCIAAGLLYRLGSVLFFFIFTYVELIDKALYLNHYYFISIVALVMIFLPANRAYSIDNLIFKRSPSFYVSRLSVGIIRLQLGLVYFFAGIAKLNYDWLVEALPLKLWLPARANLPVIGWLFDYDWFPYLMSWSGAIYDLSIPFLLMWRKSRPFAYLAVLVFHFFTYALFQIGMFPWIMIVSTLIFFDGEDYGKLANQIGIKLPDSIPQFKANISSPILYVLAIYLVIQIGMPLRHWFYKGHVGWHEAGFRYSWNVMRVEKTGHVEFRCKNPKTGKEWIAYPNQYLSPLQEKQMSFQPDMILEFAHYLDEQHEDNIEVYAESYVSLNGRASKPFVNSSIDLSAEADCMFCKYNWILEDQN